jgi:HK97 family phage major capsid protein
MSKATIALATAFSHVSFAAMLSRGFLFDKEGAPAPQGAASQQGQQNPNDTQLREEFSRLHGEAEQVIEGARGAGRELTAEEKSANDTRFNRMNAIRSVIDESQRFAAMALSGQAPAAHTNNGGSQATGASVQAPTDPNGRAQFEQHQAREIFASQLSQKAQTPEMQQRHRDAINHYIRTGESRHNQFVLTTGSGSGVLMPTRIERPTIVKKIINPYRAALAARGLQVLQTTGAETIGLPEIDDTANSATDMAENSTSENNLDPAISGTTIGAILRDSGTIWNSNTLLMTLDYDLIGYLDPLLDQRIDRKETTAWTTKLIAGTVGKTTAAVNLVTYAELIAWQHSLPLERRGNGVFFVSDQLMQALRTMVDDQNRPLFQESVRDEQPDRLLGWPIFIAPGLAAPAAAAVSGVAADAAGIVIREVTNKRIARYTNIPTHPDQFGIRKFANSDMGFWPDAVRTLKHAAS